MTAPEILYGRRPMIETLRAGRRRTRALWIADGARGATIEELRALAQRRETPVRRCPKSQLDRWTHSGHHQGVALEADPYPYGDPEDMLRAAEAAREPLFLMLLDHIEDPQNVGSLLRTAEAAGVHGVILPRDRAAAVTPAVVRASSGASEHLCVAQVGNLAEFIESWKRRGVWFFGLEAEPSAGLLTEAPLTRPLGLVVGNEGSGLGKRVAKTCDALVRLPMRGKIQSLNAAVSGAIALYEVRRQRDRSRAAGEDGGAGHVGTPLEGVGLGRPFARGFRSN